MTTLTQVQELAMQLPDRDQAQLLVFLAQRLAATIETSEPQPAAVSWKGYNEARARVRRLIPPDGSAIDELSRSRR